VFAFCNICQMYGMVPDYTKSVREVYLEFAKAEINQSKALSPIAAAGLLNMASNRFLLPSWVTDWHAMMLLMRENPSGYGSLIIAQAPQLANGGLNQNADFSILEDLTLRTPAYFMDTVKTIVPSFERSSQELELFSRKYSSSQDGFRYPTDIPGLQALIRVIILDSSPKAGGLVIEPLISGSIQEEIAIICGLLLITKVDIESTPLETTLSSVFEKHGFKTTQPFVECLNNLLPGHTPNTLWQDAEKAVGLVRTNLVNFIFLRDSIFPTCELFQTSSGYLGLVSKGVLESGGTQIGDHVVILPDSCHLLLLRKTEGRFVNLGICYVLGYNRGEGAQLILKEERLSEMIEIV